MYMFDDDMRDGYIWNNGALGDQFWKNRIQESNPLDLMGSERDTAYLWEMYPKESKIIRRLVEAALDMEDYRGSFIYDEYPDKFLFFRMANKIMEQYMKEYSNGTNGNGNNDCKNPWIIEIVQVILANEIYRRRSRRKYW